MRPSLRARWVALSQTNELRWGGDLRRHHVFRALAVRTEASTEPGTGRVALRRAVRRAAGPPWPWRHRPYLVSSDLLTPEAVAFARHATLPIALDLHDHSVAQADALGRHLDEVDRAAQLAGITANLETFTWHVVPSASFAELLGLDPSRVLVAPNGTDTDHITPGPVPEEPAVGFVSGAAPGRGIEMLIEAVGLARRDVPALRLHLWLAVVDSVSAVYVQGLAATIAAKPWIDLESVPYAELGPALATATVLAIPHPPNAYLDVAVPVKLMDGMAAGRPVVVTPRLETRRIVELAQAGLVTADDSAAAMAHSLATLFADPALARRLGDNGRTAAVHEYDWRIVGGHLADAVLACVGQGRP